MKNNIDNSLVIMNKKEKKLEDNVQMVSINDEESTKSSKIDIKSYLKPGQKAYEITKYNDNCEEHNQISYILPLARTTPKFILFIILNIFTV